MIESSIVAAVVFAGAIAGGGRLFHHRDRLGTRQYAALQTAYQTFADPVRVIEAFDPDDNGWQVLSQWQTRVLVTDGRTEMMVVPSAGTLTTGGGFALTGFDLDSLAIPFEPRAVRLEGNGDGSRGDCLGLWVIRARINAGR